MRALVTGIASLAVVLGATARISTILQPAGATVEEVSAGFASPPDDSRVMMRWWWFGPAVTREGLERELQAMRAGGLGGVEIQPVYPLALDGSLSGLRILPFLSPEFADALRAAAEIGAGLGLRVDLTLGSGWPYGGPGVTIHEAAGRLRVERIALPPGGRRVPLPAIRDGERLIAAFTTRLAGDVLADEAPQRRADVRDGVAWLPSDPAQGDILLVFIAGRTGMQVKRAAVGAEGFVLDHYSRSALDAYLEQVGAPLLEAFGSPPPFAIFCDSLEVFASNWTEDFLEEFQRRRGYDLTPHLPKLAFGAGPEAVGLRHDWSRTLTELYEERFLRPLQQWAASRGTRLRIQNYGIPPATLATSASADLPEGEGWQWRAFTASRWAASASHLYGRPVTSSETWTWLHSPTFRATPLDLKAEADLHFLQGITQLIGHGWPYTPEAAEYPGWRFYAAGAFNTANPWWLAMPDLARYLHRVSYLLRQGRPANDVAFYLPTSDAWGVFGERRVQYMLDALRERIGPTAIGGVLNAGFNLDFFDDDSLQRVGRVLEEGLQLGDSTYRIVVLPNVERMPVATLRVLDRFVASGGALLAAGRLPLGAPGYAAPPADHEEVRALVGRLFADGGPARFVEDNGPALTAALAAAATPDVRVGGAPGRLGTLHRRLADGDLYFLVNTTNRRERFEATFRARGASAEWWDPRTAQRVAADVRWGVDGTWTAFELEPYESRVLVILRARGRLPERRHAPPLGEIDLSADWRVTFPGQAPASWRALRSWTDAEETRYFSGVVRYEKTVDVPVDFAPPGARVWLDLGEGRALEPEPAARFRAWLESPVREAARVYVNGRDAGAIWAPPYALDVTDLLAAGTTALRIDVGNLAVNHMAGRALPDFALLNLRYGTRFENQDQNRIRPVPAGLLGPVTLVARPGGGSPP